MTISSFLDCERKNLEKLKNLQLPHRYKKWGVALALISIALLLMNRFIFEIQYVKPAARFGMLAGMLLISVSKEKIEDEFSARLRMQSYSFAFIMAVVYALLLPVIEYVIGILIKSKEAAVKDLGDFALIWMLLAIQIFYFEMLKRLHK